MQNITYKIRVNQLFTLPIRLPVNRKLSVRFWGNQSYTWTSDSTGAPNPHTAQRSSVLLNFPCEPFSSSLDFPTLDTSPVHGGGGGSVIPEVLESTGRALASHGLQGRLSTQSGTQVPTGAQRQTARRMGNHQGLHEPSCRIPSWLHPLIQLPPEGRGSLLSALFSYILTKALNTTLRSFNILWDGYSIIHLSEKDTKGPEKSHEWLQTRTLAEM